MLRGIYKSEYGYLSFADIYDDVWSTTDLDFEYYVNRFAGYHVCRKSAVYGEIDGFKDEVLANDEVLDPHELYVVLYWFFNGEDLEHRVDFGLSKDEIFENVRKNKYVEGAEYCTMGHMFWVTKRVLESGVCSF